MYINISVCMDIGPYSYRTIWGESILFWGFFPGEGRGELGWTVTPSLCSFGNGDEVFSPLHPHASEFIAGTERQQDVG